MLRWKNVVWRGGLNGSVGVRNIELTKRTLSDITIQTPRLDSEFLGRKSSIIVVKDKTKFQRQQEFDNITNNNEISTPEIVDSTAGLMELLTRDGEQATLHDVTERVNQLRTHYYTHYARSRVSRVTLTVYAKSLAREFSRDQLAAYICASLCASCNSSPTSRAILSSDQSHHVNVLASWANTAWVANVRSLCELRADFDFLNFRWNVLTIHNNLTAELKSLNHWRKVATKQECANYIVTRDWNQCTTALATSPENDITSGQILVKLPTWKYKILSNGDRDSIIRDIMRQRNVEIGHVKTIRSKLSTVVCITASKENGQHALADLKCVADNLTHVKLEFQISLSKDRLLQHTDEQDVSILKREQISRIAKLTQTSIHWKVPRRMAIKRGKCLINVGGTEKSVQAAVRLILQAINGNTNIAFDDTGEIHVVRLDGDRRGKAPEKVTVQVNPENLPIAWRSSKLNLLRDCIRQDTSSTNIKDEELRIACDKIVSSLADNETHAVDNTIKCEQRWNVKSEVKCITGHALFADKRNSRKKIPDLFVPALPDHHSTVKKENKDDDEVNTFLKLTLIVPPWHCKITKLVSKAHGCHRDKYSAPRMVMIFSKKQVNRQRDIKFEKLRLIMEDKTTLLKCPQWDFDVGFTRVNMIEFDAEEARNQWDEIRSYVESVERCTEYGGIVSIPQKLNWRIFQAKNKSIVNEELPYALRTVLAQRYERSQLNSVLGPDITANYEVRDVKFERKVRINEVNEEWKELNIKKVYTKDEELTRNNSYIEMCSELETINGKWKIRRAGLKEFVKRVISWCERAKLMEKVS